MRTLLIALGAMTVAAPAAMAEPVAKTEIGTSLTSYASSFAEPGASMFGDTSTNAYDQRRGHRYREWRGRDGRRYCRKSDGTTGLVVGAVGGALVGRTIDTRGDRTAGTVLGAVAGGLAGREIDRSSSRRRCR